MQFFLTLTEELYSLFSSEETASFNRKFSLRRSHLEIKMDILSCVMAGAEKPTQIMFKANLSWAALKEHLTALEQGKLLVPVAHGARTRYEMTAKATALLMAYKKILDDVSAPVEKTAVNF